MEKSFKKEGVDIDANVGMLEGQILRTRHLEIIPGGFFDSCLRIPYKSVQKDRPAFLEKCEEGLPVRNQRLQGPILKYTALTQELDEPFVQQRRNAPAMVMAEEEYAQEVRWLFDQLGCNCKDVPQDEFLGGVVSQSSGGVFILRFVQGVEI